MYSTKFTSRVTVRVVTCFGVNTMKATIRSRAIALNPCRFLSLSCLQYSNFRFNTIGPKFFDDVVQLSDRIHLVWLVYYINRAV